MDFRLTVICTLHTAQYMTRIGMWRGFYINFIGRKGRVTTFNQVNLLQYDLYYPRTKI